MGACVIQSLAAGQDASRPRPCAHALFMLPGSEPWSGSVRPKQPSSSPRAMRGQVALALLLGCRTA